MYQNLGEASDVLLPCLAPLRPVIMTLKLTQSLGLKKGRFDGFRQHKARTLGLVFSKVDLSFRSEREGAPIFRETPSRRYFLSALCSSSQ